MPELPEVETVRKSLAPFVESQKIKDVTIYLPRMIRTHEADAFRSRLIGQTIHTLSRRGKHLIWHLDEDVLISHLRMEGKFYIVEEDVPQMSHEHVRILFTSGRQLIYHDVRTFGTFDLFAKPEDIKTLKPLADLGLEPWDEGFNGAYLKTQLERRHGPIKPVLLDQTVVLGLGNIYADEVLFCAGIHPKRAASKISLKRLNTLATCIHDILSKAIRMGGTTIRTYENSLGIDGMFQNELYVHTLENEPCRICDTPIKRIKLSGRSTYYCQTCQH